MSQPAAAVVVGGRNTGDYEVVKGSVLAQCDGCKQDVWLAPSSVEFMTERIRSGLAKDDKVNCVECMFVALEKEGVL